MLDGFTSEEVEIMARALTRACDRLKLVEHFDQTDAPEARSLLTRGIMEAAMLGSRHEDELVAYGLSYFHERRRNGHANGG